MALVETPINIGEYGARRRWKWTGDDLLRMGELGLLPPEHRFELMDGEIVEIMPPSPRHAALVALIAELLEPLFRARGCHIRRESPVRLTPHHDPQPDLAIVRGTPPDYLERFPNPDDTELVVEIGESSVDYDRGEKLLAYAEAGVAEYWLVNLREQQVEVYAEPTGDRYTNCRIYKPGESLPVAGETVPVAPLLGL